MTVPSDNLRAVLNRELPISLKGISHIIERVSTRYPYLSQVEVTSIIKSFFETIRYLLLIGETISINTFASNMRLSTYQKVVNGKLKSINKIKLSTPRKIKYDR